MRFDRQQRAAFKSRKRLGVTLQTVIRHPLTANLVVRFLRGRQSFADLLLGVVGDLLPPSALTGILHPALLLKISGKDLKRP